MSAGAHGGARVGRWRCEVMRLVGAVVVVAAVGGGTMFAAGTAATLAEPAVELPPMIIEETSKAPTWLYVFAGDTEFLSRCTESTTRDFVTAQLRIHQLLREFVPAEFLAKDAIPMVSILVPQGSTPGGSDAVFRAMLDEEEAKAQRGEKAAEGKGLDSSAAGRYRFFPNLRLDDRDMTAVFTYWEEGSLKSDQLAVSAGFLSARLARRTPMLPQWVIEGVTGLFEQADVHSGPITLWPFRWISPEDTEGLQRDPESRRVLLPCTQLFAPDALLGPGHQHEVRSAAWRAQTALFVRWALDPANGPARGQFWKLVERVSSEPMSERVFTECFGFGYSDLMDRLSDYLPTAVREPVKLPVAGSTTVPRVEIQPASPAQVARLRGEWERLEIPMVRSKHPQFLARYAKQAQQTFYRATTRGERDPQLMAALGLCELEAGNLAAARPALEAAVAAHVVRPRVYFEVARMRWEELSRGEPKTRRFAAAQLQPVLDPLRQAIRQTPLLPEVVLLMAEVCLRGTERPAPGDFEAMVAAAPKLRRYAEVGLQTAMLQYQTGRRTDAVATLASAGEFVAEPAMRTRYRELQAMIAAPAK